MKRGISLIEILVAIAILVLLVGLLLPAIQSSRQIALRLQSANQLKQISLGIHDISTTKNGVLGFWPEHDAPMMIQVFNQENLIKNYYSPLMAAMAHIENRKEITDFIIISSEGVGTAIPSKLFVSPADPSLHLSAPFPSFATSYCANYLVFRGQQNIASAISDGLSNTIFCAERYRNTVSDNNQVEFEGSMINPPDITQYSGPRGVIYGSRRATFADKPFTDVYPITEGSPATARPSKAGVTFQVKPKPEDADGRQLQTPYAAGLLVAVGDGSVRMIRSSISESHFWAAITPAGGEVNVID
jgi:hypothetical protein